MDDTSATVLPVPKKSGPSSITLSLPVINAARAAYVTIVGDSKADAVAQFLEKGSGELLPVQARA